MDKLFLYFDEFGHISPKQATPGSFSHFVYTALVFKTEEDRKLFEEAGRMIINKQFSGNIFKSRNLKYKTRLRILDTLIQLRWKLHVFVVDQKKLSGPLIEYEKSFIKYFQRIFLKPITDNITEFEINFDQTGYPEFQISLKNYMESHIVKWDLFNQQRSYNIVDDKKDHNIMLCFADYFANSVGQFFCKSHYNPDSPHFIDQVLSRLQVTHFPYQETYSNKKTFVNNTKADEIISQISLSVATSRLEECYLKDERAEYQAILEFLILSYKLNPKRLLAVQELTEHLQNYFPGINDDRTKGIIGELRKLGVLIISSKGRAGYKLPNCIADFDMFFKRYLDSIVPMLSRVEQAHNIVFDKSSHSIDLIDSVENSKLLKELIKVIISN